MNAWQEYADAGERYERLFWALKAKKALVESTVDPYRATEPLPDGVRVIRRGWRDRIERVAYVKSTVAKRDPDAPHWVRGAVMPAWERVALQAQLDNAPAVTQDDVNRARAHKSACKKALQAARRSGQGTLVVA